METKHSGIEGWGIGEDWEVVEVVGVVDGVGSTQAMHEPAEAT